MVPSKVSKKARDLKSKADSAYMAQKWKKALESYQELDREVPNDVRVIQRIGDLCRRLNQNEEAAESYKQVATLFASQGFWAKAIAINKIILEIDPTDLSVQRSLAQMYSAQSKLSASQTVEEAPSPTFDRTVPERQAISISGMEPRTMDERPKNFDNMLGNTISISDEEPLTLEEAPQDMSGLGTPQKESKKIPLFSEMGVEELSAVLERLQVRKFLKDAFICEEGDLGRSMYIISDGIVEVSTRDPNGAKLVLGLLKGGDFFGEFGLLTNGERNATVQTKTDVELLEISSSDFDVIATSFPRIWVILEDYLRRRMVHNILMKSPVFRVLKEEERQKLAEFLKARKIRMGETIMLKGTSGDEMYFIKSGSVSVTVGRGLGQSIVLGELQAGDYFGEVAMLTGKPRTATVRAKTDCELYVLTRQDAKEVLIGNREVLTRLKAKMDERAKDAVETFSSYQEAKSTLNLV